MVGYDPDAETHLSQTEYALAGAGSGIITRLLCQPFDVLKIRFQIQTEMRTSTTKPKYRSLIQATKKILREEGSQAFWKGHLPAQLLSIAFGGVQFTSFELFTKIAWLLDAPGSGHSGHHHGHILHFFCGVCAGVTATTLTFPLDLIRTCLVAQGEPKVHKSVYAVGASVIKKNGYRGLFQGLVPAAIQVAPFTGLQFGFYSFFSHLIMPKSDQGREKTVLRTLLSGGLSGMAAKSLVYPLDVAKKRMQIQNMEEIRAPHFGKLKKYRNLVHCMQSMMKHEGMRGLFKGYSASLWKAALSSGFHFCIYEQICNFFRYHPIRLLHLLKHGVLLQTSHGHESDFRDPGAVPRSSLGLRKPRMTQLLVHELQQVFLDVARDSFIYNFILRQALFDLRAERNTNPDYVRSGWPESILRILFERVAVVEEARRKGRARYLPKDSFSVVVKAKVSRVAPLASS
ncbi:unnamed protein product, partial [Notodromas monacha]